MNQAKKVLKHDFLSLSYKIKQFVHTFQNGSGKKSPKIWKNKSAILSCIAGEQWFSIDNISGMSVVQNAYSAIVSRASRKRILDVNVCP